MRAAPHEFWLAGEALVALENTGTTAHRIFSSDACWIERYGSDVLVSYRDDLSRDAALRQLRIWSEKQSRPFRRVFSRFLPLQNHKRTAPVLVSGERDIQTASVAKESGISYSVDFTSGYSVGLFIDQRANRSYLRRARCRRVLNTFAYTCSFSVAAALGGAETTSIDLSKKSLDRGQQNFALNGLDPEKHRFCADDVLEVLPHLARKHELFDAIVLDPPTFSRGNKGRRFQVEHDFETLLVAALEVAAPHARVLLSTNCTRLDGGQLESLARFCLKGSRRAAKFHREPPLIDVPAQFAAQTLWLLLG